MKYLSAYACYNINDSVRMESSSGGIFSILAEWVINNDGIVYGVAMSEDCYNAEFVRITDIDSIKMLRGSKYVQAKVGNAYRMVKDDLFLGKIVLFTGTGCQINGLKKFLAHEYENLYCVDVVCHGVPSPILWQKYLKNQEECNNGKANNINFRCKDQGWSKFGIKNTFYLKNSNGVKSVYISKDEDVYMQMFLRDYCLRPSCYSCKAKNIKLSDLSIADFWGIDNVEPEMNDGKGVSLAIVRTEKGKKLLLNNEKILKLKKVPYGKAIRENPAEYKSCIKPIQRDYFFKDMKSLTFEELGKKYMTPRKLSFSYRLKRKLRKQKICIFKYK